MRQQKGLEITSEPLESSYKPAQTPSTDFLERKNGTVDLTTPSELGDILDWLISATKKKVFYFRILI